MKLVGIAGHAQPTQVHGGRSGGMLKGLQSSLSSEIAALTYTCSKVSRRVTSLSPKSAKSNLRFGFSLVFSPVM